MKGVKTRRRGVICTVARLFPKNFSTPPRLGARPLEKTPPPTSQSYPPRVLAPDHQRTGRRQCVIGRVHIRARSRVRAKRVRFGFPIGFVNRFRNRVRSSSASGLGSGSTLKFKLGFGIGHADAGSGSGTGSTIAHTTEQGGRRPECGRSQTSWTVSLA